MINKLFENVCFSKIFLLIYKQYCLPGEDFRLHMIAHMYTGLSLILSKFMST